jgi:hypothetical protein
MADVDTMSGGGDSPPADAMPDKGMDKNTVVLSADHFPQGMSPKEGDKLTFCVTSAADSEGNVSGYFEMGDGMGKSGDDDWEQNFRKSMSPTAPQEGAE